MSRPVQLLGVRCAENSMCADSMRAYAGPRGIELLWVQVEWRRGDNSSMFACFLVDELEYIRHGRALEQIGDPFGLGRQEEIKVKCPI